MQASIPFQNTMNITKTVLIKHDLTKSNEALTAAKDHMAKKPSQRVDKPIQTIGLTKSDEGQSAELKALTKTPNSKTIIEHDNPESRYQTNVAQALLLNQEQLNDNDGSLGLNEPRGGWHAQNYEVVSGSADAVKTLTDAGAEIVKDYGNKITYRSADHEKINDRAQAEGYGNIKGYVDSVAKVATMKAEAFGDSPRNDVYKQDGFIRKLNAALEQTNFQDGHSKVLQASLLDHMIRLEDQRVEALDNHNNQVADQIAEAQQNLKKDYGLDLEYKSSFIFARQAKGAALKVPFLGIIVKRPGDVPSHDVDTSGEVNTPSANNDSVIVTARGQIQDRIYTNRVEDLARSLNIKTELSLLTGHEVQAMVEGESLETATVDNPDSLDNKAYEQIVKTALTHEALGLEVEDWSASNFIIADDSVKLVDLGGSKPMSDPKAITERLEDIRNISESFHSAGDAKATLKTQAEKLHDQVLGNKNVIGKLIEDVKIVMDSKGIEYDHGFGDRVLTATI